MLQYPLQLPPLSLSSSPKSAPKDNDYFRPHEPRFPPNPLTKRLNKDSFVNRSVISPLAISANHAPSPSNTSPSANSIKLPRSPYISSRPLSTSIPISTVKAHNGPTQSRASSASSTIEDVLAPGDIVGEGCSLQGESIRLVSISSQLDVDDDPELREPAQEFEVVRRLGSGSYAVVYLVKEVLSRSPPSEDGHMSTIGSMEFDSNLARRPETLYGREYAVKCLSKANLDEEALDAQLTEVRAVFSLAGFFYLPALTHIPRLLFISHCIHTPTLSPFTGLSRRLHFCFFYWNTFLVKICFTFWNRLAITMNRTVSIRLTQSPFLVPPQLPVYFPIFTLLNYFPGHACGSSPLCSPRCVMPWQPVMPSRSFTVISSPKTSS